MLNLEQQNLDLVIDEKSAHEALDSIIAQLHKKSNVILSLIHARFPEWGLDLLNVEKFSLEFMDEVFQPLAERVSDISPREPEQKSHPLRKFNHDILMSFPVNFQQMLIAKLIKSNSVTIKDIVSSFS